VVVPSSDACVVVWLLVAVSVTVAVVVKSPLRLLPVSVLVRNSVWVELTVTWWAWFAEVCVRVDVTRASTVVL
jgi:hypothetical protein